MGVIQNIFGKVKRVVNVQKWKELGKYQAIFSCFGTDIYKSDIVRSCIRPLAEHTAKANVKCTDERIQKILDVSPNMYMNGHDFLKKIRTRLEIKNTAFIYIQKDDKANVIGFYPVPFNTFEAIEYANGLYIKFNFSGDAAQTIVLPWEELAVLRKDYNESDIAGDDNSAVLPLLDLIKTTNQGVSNAVKATANLRGILKSTKAMLSPEDIKKNKETFVKDYLNLENEGGIASLDSTQEFTPIKMEPTIANYEQMREFRENVYRYFGISDAIVMSNYTEEQMEAFYEARIEPFLIALSLELTRKVFSEHARGFGNKIVYEANRLQFASMKTKISIFKEVVQYGGMTVNEWRLGCNMEEIKGGDIPIRRLDAAPVTTQQTEEGEEKDGSEE